MTEATRNVDKDPMADLFVQMAEATDEKSKREIARNIVIQSINNSRAQGDSFNQDKHYTTPQIQIGMFENIACKIKSA